MKTLIHGILVALVLVLGFAYLPTAHGEALTTLEVPIPPSVWLFGSGLLGLVAIARRKKRHNDPG